jgi:hypothetical protein
MARNQTKLRRWLEGRGIALEDVKPFKVHLSADTAVDDWGARTLTAPVTYDHPDYEGWTFTLTLRDGGGVIRFCAELDESGAGETITSRQLRDVPLGKMALAVRAAWALEDERHFGEVLPRYEPRRRERSGPAPVADEELVEAMVHYMAHGTQKGAESYGCSTHSMNRYRREAVRRGLFVSYGRGKEGGFLTAKGEATEKGMER